MKEYIPYIISTLTLILTSIKFILDEKRARRKERLELLDRLKDAENEKGTFPPRKETHQKR